MNTSTLQQRPPQAVARTELLFTETELAKASGMAAYDLRQYQPAGFGAPGHWMSVKTGGMVYTARGVEALASELDRLGVLSAASVGLRYLLRERQEVPSRQLPLTAEALREVPHRPRVHRSSLLPDASGPVSVPRSSLRENKGRWWATGSME